MINTPEELHSIMKLLAPKHNIRRVLVFGSVARGDYSTQSDIDLVVALNNKSLDWKSLIDFDEELQKLCERPIQSMLDKDVKSLSLFNNIAEDGVVVWPKLETYKDYRLSCETSDT